MIVMRLTHIERRLERLMTSRSAPGKTLLGKGRDGALRRPLDLRVDPSRTPQCGVLTNNSKTTIRERKANRI